MRYYIYWYNYMKLMHFRSQLQYYVTPFNYGWRNSYIHKFALREVNLHIQLCISFSLVQQRLTVESHSIEVFWLANTGPTLRLHSVIWRLLAFYRTLTAIIIKYHIIYVWYDSIALRNCKYSLVKYHSTDRRVRLFALLIPGASVMFSLENPFMAL